MKLRFVRDGELVEVTVERRDDGFEVSFGETRRLVTMLDEGVPAGASAFDGRPLRYLARRDGSVVRIALGGEVHTFELSDRAGGERGAHGTRNPETRSPMPGKVLQLSVAVGDRVSPGDPLLILEAMKMENVLSAEVAGVVEAVHVAEGDMVEPGKVLVVVRPEAE